MDAKNFLLCSGIAVIVVLLSIFVFHNRDNVLTLALGLLLWSAILGALRSLTIGI